MSFDTLLAPHLPALHARMDGWLHDQSALGLPQPFALQAQTTPAGAPHLHAMVRDQLATGGKRLRGLLPPALVAAAGGPVDAAVTLGACIELIHNGTLVHDDVQDDDRLRRGQPTLWTLHGIPQAINVGDAMLVAPIALILRDPAIVDGARPALARLLAEAVVETIRGQVADIDLRDKDPISFDDLAAVHLAKTGPLFGACLEGAAILLDRDDGACAQARLAARHLGLAFQIRDDVLDLAGTKGRGDRGADIREGKVTVPLLLAAGHDPSRFADLRTDLATAAAGTPLEPAVVDRWVAWAIDQGGLADAEARLAKAIEDFATTATAALGAACAPVVEALATRLRQTDG